MYTSIHVSVLEAQSTVLAESATNSSGLSKPTLLAVQCTQPYHICFFFIYSPYLDHLCTWYMCLPQPFGASAEGVSSYVSQNCLVPRWRGRVHYYHVSDLHLPVHRNHSDRC